MAGNESSREKGIVIVPQAVLDKIDRNKDDLSRAEFIEACIDALLEGKEAGERGGRTSGGDISREEFDDFKKSLRSLQQAIIEMLLAFAVEPAARSSKAEQERLLQRVKDMIDEKRD